METFGSLAKFKLSFFAYITTVTLGADAVSRVVVVASPPPWKSPFLSSGN